MIRDHCYIDIEIVHLLQCVRSEDRYYICINMDKSFFGLAIFLFTNIVCLIADGLSSHQIEMDRAINGNSTVENATIPSKEENDQNNVQDLEAQVLLQLNQQNEENLRMIVRLFKLNENLKLENRRNIEKVEILSEQVNYLNLIMGKGMPKPFSSHIIASKICITNVNNQGYLHSDAKNVYTTRSYRFKELRTWEVKQFYSFDLHKRSFSLDNFYGSMSIVPNQHKQTCREPILWNYNFKNSFLWEIIPVSNGVKIKHAFYNDSYLTICESDGSKSFVGTSSDNNSSKFIWTIEEC